MAEKINPPIKLVVGLGNPGVEYKNTFHNLGFLTLDYLSRGSKFRQPPQPPPKEFEYFKTPHLIFVRPLTFMNESGRAVRQALRYFSVAGKKMRPVEILVIHDDADIEWGKYKLSFGRGAAGHKGVESIIKNLKTKNFWRLRLGLKKAGPKIKADKIVLQKIPPLFQKKLSLLFQKIEKEVLSQKKS